MSQWMMKMKQRHLEAGSVTNYHDFCSYVICDTENGSGNIITTCSKR